MKAHTKIIKQIDGQLQDDIVLVVFEITGEPGYQLSNIIDVIRGSRDQAETLMNKKHGWVTYLHTVYVHDNETFENNRVGSEYIRQVTEEGGSQLARLAKVRERAGCKI